MRRPGDPATVHGVEIEAAADAIRAVTGQGSVALWVHDGVLWIQVRGEPTGAALLHCIRQGLLAGRVRLAMPTIVDLSRFDGVVDWPSLRAILALAPWGKGAPQGAARVGYVVHDGWFEMLIKVVRTLFASAQHRGFVDVAEALAWVRDGGVRIVAAAD